MRLLVCLLLFPSLFAVKVEQVHLSYSGIPSQMTVTWLTLQPLDDKYRPYVGYGISQGQLSERAPATVTGWHDEGSKATERYTYRATMDGLTPGMTYYYSVGSDDTMSSVFHFTAIDNSKPLRAAIYGDFSILMGLSMDPLINATANGDFDIVFHIGDIAYDMEDNNGNTGDNFMNAIQPIAAYVPYMVIAGNHDMSANFNHLRNRFTMPSNGVLDGNQFWSMDIGNTHFIGLSTEYYGSHMSNETQLQYTWLLNDLKQTKAKWIVAFMHRPMYCCDRHFSGCQDRENTMTRNGEPGFPALEPLFNHGAVDMVFWGHMHTYERNYPVFESVAYPQNNKQAFHNAQTPIYTLTGAAGCHDHAVVQLNIKQKYTAEQLGEYGYSILQVQSDTLINTHFVNAANPSMFLDEFSLSKDVGYRPGQVIGKNLLD